MSNVPTGQAHGSGHYEIRVKGHLEPRWTAYFNGLTLRHENNGTTVLHGFVADQAALHGLLHKLRDTGLPLVCVQVRADQHEMPPPSPESPLPQGH